MNTNAAIVLFLLVISGLIWAGMHSNDPNWTGNANQCVGCLLYTSDAADE